MDDLIKRQDSIDALGEEPEVWSGKDEYAQGRNNQWHDDVNALRTVPSAQPDPNAGYSDGFADGYRQGKQDAQPEPQWIPCSERLPEKYGIYIVTDIDGDVEIASFQEDWRHDEEIQAWWLEEYGFIEVLAWMPLPEPWRGEEHEHTMEEFMYGQDMGNPEDGSL